MKKHIFRLALLILLTFGMFNVIAIKENKQACAIGCSIDWYAVALEFVQWGVDNILSWFENALRIVENFFQFKIESSLKVETMMKTISQQDRLADIETTKQIMQLREAGEISKKTTLYQKEQVDTVARRFPAPSDQTCKDVTAKARYNQIERYADFEKTILREKKRIKQGLTSKVSDDPYDSYPVSSSSLYGPTVRETALKNQQIYRCYRDSDNGNMYEAGFCPYPIDYSAGATGAWLDYAVSPSLLITPHVTGRAELNAGISLLQEYLSPPTADRVFPKEVKKDPALQDQYMASVRQAAIQNLNDEIINGFITEIIRPSVYGSHPQETEVSNCQDNAAFVSEIASRRYGHPAARPGGNAAYEDVCPSVSEMQWAEVMSVADPSYIAASNTALKGNTYQAHLNAVSLDHRLAFDELQAYRTSLLQNAINSLASKNNFIGSSPVDSIAR